MPAALLATLFPHSLIVVDEDLRKAASERKNEQVVRGEVASVPPQDVAKATADTSVPRVLGEFRRKVLIVVHDAHAVHLGDGSLELLSKILAAVRLSIADVAVLNLAGNRVTYPELPKDLRPVVALFLGPEPASFGLPIQFPMFQVQAWNQCSFLWAPSLDDMQKTNPETIDAKKKLWGALQQLFV